MVTICTTSLTFSNSTFCAHSVFVCFVWISEQTAIISLYNINWLVFTTETESVYFTVRNGSLYTILRSAHTVYLCVLCGSQNKQRLSPYTALTDQLWWTSYRRDDELIALQDIHLKIPFPSTVLWLTINKTNSTPLRSAHLHFRVYCLRFTHHWHILQLQINCMWCVHTPVTHSAVTVCTVCGVCTHKWDNQQLMKTDTYLTY